jgi:trk system potassium uptake protein TrkA
MGQQNHVVGLGTFGSMVARELSALGHEVLGCDLDPAAVADIAAELTGAVELDATDPDALAAIGPAQFDAAVVSLDRPSTILATMLLEQAGAATIVARAATELDGEILRRVGADRVLLTDRQMATWVAHTIDLAGAIDFISLSADTAAVHMRVGDRVVGRKVGDVVRDAAGLSLVALHRDGHVTVAPAPDTVFVAGDTVLVIGPEDSFRSLNE